MRSFGALPPDEFAWQVGKTAASILWVKYLEDMKSYAGTTAREAMQHTIDALKQGTLVASAAPTQGDAR